MDLLLSPEEPPNRLSATIPIAVVQARSDYEYGVFMQRGLIHQVGKLLKRHCPISTVIIVTDAHVDAIHADALMKALSATGYHTLKFVMRPHRTAKSLATASELLEFLFAHDVDRQGVILTFGGGTVGDFGGFVAALFLRGIRYINIPTTLVSQADSCVGGKVNVNFGDHLNSVSVFRNPAAVWVDPQLLSTLSDEEYRSGVAEIVKYAVALDAELFSTLEAKADEIVRRDAEVMDSVTERCLQRKAEIVCGDAQEADLFQLFSYGHEIGHALEVAFDYDGLRHGEAVSIGMHATAWLGQQAGLTAESVCLRQTELMAKLQLPSCIPSHLRTRAGSPEELFCRVQKLLYMDKRRTPSGLVWVIPEIMGRAVCTTAIETRWVTACLHRVAHGAAYQDEDR